MCRHVVRGVFISGIASGGRYCHYKTIGVAIRIKQRPYVYAPHSELVVCRQYGYTVKGHDRNGCQPVKCEIYKREGQRWCWEGGGIGP